MDGMKRRGLCSVTFRKKTPEQVIGLARASGVNLIEWGGDIHVPAGDTETAARVGEMTRAAGLECISYGSYFRCDNAKDFLPVSATAEALGAGVIRVWAGKKDYEEFTVTEKQAFFETVRACAEIAGEKGQIVAFEFHHHTFCNRADHVAEALEQIACPNVKTYWQPDYWTLFRDDTERIGSNRSTLTLLKERIVNVHFYSMDGYKRLPLAGSEDEWRQYLHILPATVPCFLEFVKDDSEEQFRADMDVMKSIF